MGAAKVNYYEKELLHRVFEKIKAEKGATSVNNTAELLEDILLEKYNHKKSARTLVRYYNKYVLEKEESCGAISFEFNNCLAKILGHHDFTNFIDTHEENGTDKIILKSKNKTILIIGGFLLLLLIFYFLSFNKIASYDKKWMFWNGTNYELFTTDMSVNSLKTLQLVPYVDTAITYHKKIALKCDTPIKNVWYYKLNSNKLEFFNFSGLHPLNGKTLKALTKNMKKKYVCERENTKN